MKCVLAAPFVEWTDEYYGEDVCLENPGLGLLAAVLEQYGYDVVIRDGNLEDFSLDDLLSDLYGASFLGLSLDSSVVKETSRWLFSIKKAFE